jgi:hypothetical protein
MSFKDLETKNAAPHVDTPAQAEARAAAAADLKTKNDAKAAKNASQREAKAKQGAANAPKGGAPEKK